TGAGFAELLVDPPPWEPAVPLGLFGETELTGKALLLNGLRLLVGVEEDSPVVPFVDVRLVVCGVESDELFPMVDRPVFVAGPERLPLDEGESVERTPLIPAGVRPEVLGV